MTSRKPLAPEFALSHTLIGLGRGASHSHVRSVKRLLRAFGYLADPGDVESGILTRETELAIARYQRFHGFAPDAVVNASTLQMLNTARCAMPDVDPVGAIATGPWKKRRFTFAMNRIDEPLPSKDWTAAVRRAASSWEAVGVGLTFKEVASSHAANLVVEWRPSADPDRDMTGPQVAHADLPPGFSIVVTAPPLPVHFDHGHPWAVNGDADAHDVETVALHEFGHCLGLLHSDDPTSVMFPYLARGHVARTPRPADAAAIRILYPAN